MKLGFVHTVQGVIRLSLGVIEKPVWCDHYSCFFVMIWDSQRENRILNQVQVHNDDDVFYWFLQKQNIDLGHIPFGYSAQRQKDVTELLVCQDRELLVVVEGEVLYKERGNEARAQGVDAERHSPRRTCAELPAA